jgi:short-subunit dehydrogenase
MLEVNMAGPVALTHHLLPALRERGADIVNVASTAAFLPMVYSAAYAASKAFVLHWSLALGEELRGTNIHVLAVCPGTTRTDFFRRAGFAEATLQGRFMQTADEVVAEAMTALGDRKVQVITGWKNRVMIRLATLLPKPLVTKVAGRILRRYWEKQPK